MPDRLLTGAIAAPLAQMMGNDGGMGGGTVMMVAMMVVMLLFVVLAVLGVIWLVRSLLRDRAGRERDDCGPDALRVLERRLAEGEIESNEYRERRSILERGR